MFFRQVVAFPGVGNRRNVVIGALLATLVLCGVLTAAFLVMRVDRGESGAQATLASAAVLAPGFTQAGAGSGWSASAVQSVDADAVITLDWSGRATGSPRVVLQDSATGQTLAELEVSYNPLVVRRAGANELLVSDVPDSGPRPGSPDAPPADVGARLLVFDLANRLAMKREIPLPNRVRYTAYSPYAAALSSDERYFYYLTRENRTDRPECRPRGNAGTAAPSPQNAADSAVCDRMSVVVLDLSNPAATRPSFELPVNCGYAALSPTGPSSVVAACRNIGQVFVLDPSARATRSDDFSGELGMQTVPQLRQSPVLVRYGFATASGQLGVLLDDGTVVVRSDAGSVSEVRALPANQQAFSAQVSQLGPGRLVVGYGGYAEPTLRGFVVVDAENLRVERDEAIPGARSVAAGRDADTVLVLEATGIESIDARTNARRMLPGGLATSDEQVLIP